MNRNDNDSGGQEANGPLPVTGIASSLFGTAGSLECYRKRIRAVTQPLGGLQKVLGGMSPAERSGLTQHSSVLKKLALPTEQFARLGASRSIMREIESWQSFQQEAERVLGQQGNIAEMFTLPSEIFAHNLDRVGSRLSDLSINVNYPQLSERMLAPLTYFSRFSRETLSVLRDATEAHSARALSGSLLLAEDQLSATTDLLTDILQRPVGPDQVGDAPAYTLFERVRDDLLGAEQLPPVDEPERLYEISRSTALAAEVRMILKRTASCNRNAQMKGDDEIFRPTTGMLEAAADLGFLAVARDETEMGPVVDALYALLYEGAGAGRDTSPRYLERGYVSDDECDVVWVIKHLRNYWLRHDHGHGSKSDQKRKMKKLGATLGKYGLNRMPSGPDDYEKLHRGLIQDVCDFLELVERRVS